MIFKDSSHFRVDIGGDLLYREGGQTDVEVLHSILHQVSQLELVDWVIMALLAHLQLICT